MQQLFTLECCLTEADRGCHKLDTLQRSENRPPMLGGTRLEVARVAACPLDSSDYIGCRGATIFAHHASLDCLLAR